MTEKIPETPSHEITVSYNESAKEYKIVSPDMFTLAYRMYRGLGGEELDEEGCKKILEQRGELRPRSGIFAIRVVSMASNKLAVENRNMKHSEEMNKLLKTVVERETE